MTFGMLALLPFPLSTVSAQTDKGRELVVEARLLTPGEGSKYHWMKIEIRKVLVPMETFKKPMPTSLDVVRLYDQPDVSTSWCKVRLVPYGSSLHPDLWKVTDWQKLEK